MSAAPASWEGVGRGDPELVTQWRRETDRRQEFEARHPDYAEQREAVAAHEGHHHGRPLTYRELAARGAAETNASRQPP